jgi:ABC-type transport system substrate-binding protein
MKNLFLVALAILLIAGIGLGGCAKSTSAPASSSTTTSASSPATTSASSPTPAKPVPQTGGILKILDEWTPSLPIGNPVKVNSFSEFILKPCFESLWLIDKSGALQPVLATSWEVSSNQTSITFHLRQGVKFHDGTDWNAAAAKWNMDAWKTAKREGTDIWSTIDVLDDYTIRLNLTKYQNTENMDLSSVTFMSPTAYQKNGEEWAGLNPVGTGPFKLKENVPKQYVKFERFAGYWGQQPYVDEIDISFVTDPTTISNAMQAKEAQIAIMGFDKALVDLKNLGFNVIFDDGFFFFAPSSADPNSPLSNLKVRQAIDYAIDRQVLSKNIASGLLQPVNQLVTSSSYAYNPEIQNQHYSQDWCSRQSVARRTELVSGRRYSGRTAACHPTNNIPVCSEQALGWPTLLNCTAFWERSCGCFDTCFY